MKICSHCGMTLPDNARFCSKCGTNQENEQKINQVTSMNEDTEVLNTDSKIDADRIDTDQDDLQENIEQVSEQQSELHAISSSLENAEQIEQDEQESVIRSEQHNMEGGEESENVQSGNADSSQPLANAAETASAKQGFQGDPTEKPKTSFWKKYGKYIYPVAAGFVGAAAFSGIFFTFQNTSGNASGKAQVTQTTPKTNATETVARTNTAKVANEVKDAVVSINNKQKTQATTSTNALDDLFGSDDNSDKAASGELQLASQGSGVIYAKEGDKAYIVTNNHVIQDADEVEVILNDQTKLSAKVVGQDAYSDLAVLSVDGNQVKGVAEFGDSSEVQAGDLAIAMGSPLGSEYAGSVTEGIISAKERVINVPLSSNSQETRSLRTIQTDAAINAGNSGGPLLNADGQVIGINSVKYSSGSSLASNTASVEGMGFAIPSNDVVSIINELVENGKISRPKLGIEFYNLSNIDASKRESNLKLPNEVTSGVLVAKVTDNSAAANAGLKVRDVIVEMDGEQVDSENLKAKLYEKKVGDTIELKLYRDGKEQTVKVKLDKEQDETTEQQKQPSTEKATEGNNSTLDDFFK